MEFRKIKIADLVPASYNPRKALKPGDKEYEKIKRSIEEFGYCEPVIVNSDMTIIGGHQRVTVLRDLGYTEIDCIVIEIEKTKEKALNIALNKITGEWNKELLADLIEDLQDSDFDVTFTGFDPPEIEQLMNTVHDKDIVEDDFDVEAQLEKPTISKEGDLWLLGEHRLVCGDSTLPETYDLLMDGRKANLVVTDPPYNVDYEGSAGKIKNDKMAEEQFEKFLFAAFVNMEQSMMDDASIYVFHSDSHGLAFRRSFEEAGFYLSGCCIWKKNSLVLGRSPYKRKTRVAAYCRVSTDQEEQENSFKNQVDYYTRYISEHPDYELAGIYADEGISGTNTKKREEFKRMIADCEAHKIDMVITKSISRFARNTQDCLENYRKLKNLGVVIIFEKENISSAETTGELLLTILSSLAQDESRNISENCKWGIRSKFKEGIPHINTCNFMGFDKDSEGRLVVNEEEAKLVRRIFREFLEGFSCSTIAARLNEEGIPGARGEPKWISPTIEGMLKNEKYMGDSLLQKHVTIDFLTKKQIRNNGQVTQYYVKDSHEAIVSREDWNAVQQEFERRDAFREKHKLSHVGYGSETRPFSSKIICGECGHIYGRKAHLKTTQKTYWQCNTRCYKGPKSCKAENVPEETIHRVFIEAWNTIVRDQDTMNQYWDRLEKSGTELERLRARQMREMAKQGPLTTIVPELVQTVLESITVKGGGAFEIRFLDGTEFQMKF